MINKDTLLFGSFSKKAGNVGCIIFNTCFKHYNINAIYKSFSVNDLNDAIISAKCLGFSGFAVSMPFKSEIISYLDKTDEIVQKTNSCNTVIVKNGKLEGYNTDYYSIYDYLDSLKIIPLNISRDWPGEDLTMGLCPVSNLPRSKTKMYILGNGAYSRNVQICCKEMNIEFELITRENWDKILSIENSIIFNCTPVENINYHDSNIFIDCNTNSETGKKLALKQASLQFELYTALKFPNNVSQEIL